MTTTKQKTNDREDWLTKGAALIRHLHLDKAPVFATISAPIRVTCGYPKGQRTAKCLTLPRAASTGNVNEIFISPEIDDPVQVLANLTLQLIVAECDAQTGCLAKGQTGEFWARQFGLLGPLAGAELPAYGKCLDGGAIEALESVAAKLGPYPHQRVLPGRKKDGTRQLKVECLDPKCGAIWRASRRWVDQMTTCPCCQGKLIQKHV